ncbi:MAG: hypothetical protein FIB06_08410 [Betaproteobacteria bacterium]|nr:hypothetical protein [Betaproteobacteria bacterium]
MFLNRKPAAMMLVAIALPFCLPGDAEAQTPAQGQAQSRDIRVSGVGKSRCSEWNAWKEGQKGQERATALEWAQGFIAGHNVYARVNNLPPNSVVADNRILIPLLDTYCQQYPDSLLLNGMIEIIKNLGGVAINVAPKAPARPNPAPAPDKKGPQAS